MFCLRTYSPCDRDWTAPFTWTEGSHWKARCLSLQTCSTWASCRSTSMSWSWRFCSGTRSSDGLRRSACGQKNRLSCWQHRVSYFICAALMKIAVMMRIFVSGSWRRSCWMWRGKGRNGAVENTVREVVPGARSLWVDSPFSRASVRCATTTFVKTAEQSSPEGPGCAACAPRSRKRLFFFLSVNIYRLEQNNAVNFVHKYFLPGMWRRWRVTGSTIRGSTVSPQCLDTAWWLSPSNREFSVSQERGSCCQR